MRYHRVDSGPNQSDGFSLATACASVALIFLTTMGTMEIVCGGIGGVPKDQLLAARALGFSFVQIVTTVVRPQAARIMKWSLVNQLVLVIKAPIDSPAHWDTARTAAWPVSDSIYGKVRLGQDSCCSRFFHEFFSILFQHKAFFDKTI